TDEQPITFAANWEEITLRRRRYNSPDLRRISPAEAKIREALREPTALEFFETPLSDVVDYLKDLHGIEVQLDLKALGDEGIAMETPVTLKMKGVSLKTGLRTMLDRIDLTYVIRDEVLMITTPSRAADELTTRVYPVADIVTPVRPVLGMPGG